MANASLTDRLSPVWDNSAQDAHIDEALAALDGIDGALNDIVNNTAKSNSSDTGEIKAAGTIKISRPKEIEEPKLDAHAARVNTSFAQLQCIFQTMLSEHCGYLKSRDTARRSSWESVCLDAKHAHDSSDAYVLMSAEERKYSRKVRQLTPAGRQSSQLWMENEQYKAILCMQMKLIDDGCLSFKKPRFFPHQVAAVKNSKVDRSFVDPNKTRSVVKQVKQKVEVGTMSAGKDDAAKLVRDELEVVHNIKSMKLL